MSSQNHMQTPKNWRFALKKKAQDVRKSHFTQNLVANDIELCAIGALLSIFTVIAIFSSLHDAFSMFWGAIIGVIILIIAIDRADNRYRKKIISRDDGFPSSIHNFGEEGYSGKLMIMSKGCYREDMGNKHFLEQVLEEMVGEAGIAEARSTYETFIKAAEDPYDDTGWDEPWAEALASAFEHAVEVVEERERGNG